MATAAAYWSPRSSFSAAVFNQQIWIMGGQVNSTDRTNDVWVSSDGTNYAQARYLCYYLQEKGLLARFYKEFTPHAKDDPTGYKTLVKILDEKDMAAFQKRWEAFVMKLRFP